METAERKTDFGLTALNSELFNSDKEISRTTRGNIDQAKSILVEVVKEVGLTPLKVQSNSLVAQVIVESHDELAVELCVDPEEIWDGPSDDAIIFRGVNDEILREDIKGPRDLEEILEDIKHRSDEYGVNL